jgi:hypothetical protein
MQYTFEIIALACAAYLFAVGADPVQRLKERMYLEDVKVLNCPRCFGFWLGLYFMLYFTSNITDSILSAFIIAILADVIDKHLSDEL